jgi:hypothetical protein
MAWKMMVRPNNLDMQYRTSVYLKKLDKNLYPLTG